MNQELKNAIIKAVQDNFDEFQLTNSIGGIFREYIYTKDGEYLIGGEQVAKFINDFIILYINN